jgi:HSP20 family protein
MIKKIIPVSRLVRLEYKIHRIQNRAVHPGPDRLGYAEGWFPHMDVCEKGNKIVVELEMPGILPEDVVILVHHNRLEVRGLKKEEPLPEGGTYLRVEREYGPFRRVIDLPASILPDKAKAKAVLQEGVLIITLKKPENQRKKV